MIFPTLFKFVLIQSLIQYAHDKFVTVLLPGFAIEW